ncbi:lycopene cyclase [Segetibacter sp. 3557_3]|uniref:lycopene cyclase family protein n=1 Tax=Segetibacter sp. 3557_3 TaxID=2547429 RepID=UPI0010586ED9|nr:lycopene cyclase family protein [Segetibacter sp. 3557_3]TDH27410.1 lycopene cyclase [Segetibacter sp. 3557_3]
MTPDLNSSYDYVFLGAGCASLSIVMRMLDSGKFAEKTILLLDKSLKDTNDRTWCFWEAEGSFFEPVVFRKWKELHFFGDQGPIQLNIEPYEYKMIRGIDFYRFCFEKISHHPNVQVAYGEIATSNNAGKVEVTLDGKPVNTLHATVFNSIYIPSAKRTHTIYLLQHFKGWIIETPGNTFNTSVGTLMDFRVNQAHGTTFVYVLPIAPNRALVEYTLFTADLLAAEAYDEALAEYIRTFLNLTDYSVVEKEFGIIPMTNAVFPRHEGGMYYIGTAGGQTKASSGYTFRFIQKHADFVVEALINGTALISNAPSQKRFAFYDSTLLHILAHNKVPGKEVFTRLFERNKSSAIFRFLDNETSLVQEIQLIKTLPTLPFAAAGLKELLHKP